MFPDEVLAFIRNAQPDEWTKRTRRRATTAPLYRTFRINPSKEEHDKVEALIVTLRK
jgi:hypothetical protein